jgi:hypothetical protein
MRKATMQGKKAAHTARTPQGTTARTLARRLETGFEDAVDGVVGEHRDIDRRLCAGGVRVCRRERDEDIAGDGAGTGKAHRGAAGEALRLMREQRGICGAVKRAPRSTGSSRTCSPQPCR